MNYKSNQSEECLTYVSYLYTNMPRSALLPQLNTAFGLSQEHGVCHTYAHDQYYVLHIAHS